MHSCGQFESFLALLVVEIGGGQKNEAKVCNRARIWSDRFGLPANGLKAVSLYTTGKVDGRERERGRERKRWEERGKSEGRAAW